MIKMMLEPISFRILVILMIGTNKKIIQRLIQMGKEKAVAKFGLLNTEKISKMVFGKKLLI